METNALRTRPVSSTFPATDVPEIRDSSIEETSDAAAEAEVERKDGYKECACKGVVIRREKGTDQAWQLHMCATRVRCSAE